jgi:hypothetical protein
MYLRFHVEKQDERLGLFERLVERYGVRSALYPGSFVHVTPSFVIPTVVYADSDRRARRFFADPGAVELIKGRRTYGEEPTVRFHYGDYAAGFPEPAGSFDLLISQYAGFVSRAGKRYVRLGGHLVANNSHGDASMAALDPDWKLVAVYTRRGERFTLASDELDTYMIPKRGPPPTVESLEASMRGVAFTRRAGGYVFRREAPGSAEEVKCHREAFCQ